MRARLAASYECFVAELAAQAPLAVVGAAHSVTGVSARRIGGLARARTKNDQAAAKESRIGQCAKVGPHQRPSRYRRAHSGTEQ